MDSTDSPSTKKTSVLRDGDPKLQELRDLAEARDRAIKAKVKADKKYYRKHGPFRTGEQVDRLPLPEQKKAISQRKAKESFDRVSDRHDVTTLIQWLERRDRPENDVVERLVRLSYQRVGPFDEQDPEQEIADIINDLRDQRHFRLVPVAVPRPIDPYEEPWPVVLQVVCDSLTIVDPADKSPEAEQARLMNEQVAVLSAAIRLGAAGRLIRVRRCERCNKPFYAVQYKKRFCTDVCEFASRTSKPAFKARRAAAARQRRAREKKEKSKKGRK
jgi:hypothetical protein